MTKYLFNSNIFGYETWAVDDFNKQLNNDDVVTIVLDKSTEDLSSCYYNLANQAISNQCRLILIGVGELTATFRSIASNMILYKKYDIYQVSKADEVNASYMDKIEKRTPDLEEVKQFIDGDIIAYSEISNHIFAINSLVNEGNLDGLREYVENNINSIDSIVIALNRLKETADRFNTAEFDENIKQMAESIEQKVKELEAKDEEISNIKHEKDVITVELDTLKRELKNLKEFGQAPAQSSAQGTSVIKNYQTLQTQMVQSNKAIVLYFKEISYVKYMNTFVNMICEHLKTRKVSYKLLIYDSSAFVRKYGMQTINASNYTQYKSALVKELSSAVITEPFNQVLTDMLQAVDVLIVYDRYGKSNDILKGNVVTRYLVINSKNDMNMVYNYSELINGKPDPRFIITSDENTFVNQDKQAPKFLTISYIDGFSSSSDSKKIQSYNKLGISRYTEDPNAKLIRKVLDDSHISSKF